MWAFYVKSLSIFNDTPFILLSLAVHKNRVVRIINKIQVHDKCTKWIRISPVSNCYVQRKNIRLFYFTINAIIQYKYAF